MVIKIRRAYEEPETSDDVRVLIDRLWPRGKTKEALKIEEWMRDITLTVELIKWFEFKVKAKYKRQLDEKGVLISKLKQQSKK